MKGGDIRHPSKIEKLSFIASWISSTHNTFINLFKSD